MPQAAATIDPVLKELDHLLDDDQLYQQVRTDFYQRYLLTLVHGRHPMPVEVLLLMLICRQLYQWSYQETARQVFDSLVLSWFCRLYWAEIPNATTLIQ